jgi:hypothetical protein
METKTQLIVKDVFYNVSTEEKEQKRKMALEVLNKKLKKRGNKKRSVPYQRSVETKRSTLAIRQVKFDPDVCILLEDVNKLPLYNCLKNIYKRFCIQRWESLEEKGDSAIFRKQLLGKQESACYFQHIPSRIVWKFSIRSICCFSSTSLYGKAMCALGKVDTYTSGINNDYRQESLLTLDFDDRSMNVRSKVIRAERANLVFELLMESLDELIREDKQTLKDWNFCLIHDRG